MPDTVTAVYPEVHFEPEAEFLDPYKDAAAIRAFVAELKVNPRKWALFRQHKSSSSARQYACDIRNQNIVVWQDAFGNWEAQMRSMLGEHRIYVRYMPLEG